MRRLLFAALLAPVLWAQQDIVIQGKGPYRDIVRGGVFGSSAGTPPYGVNNNFIFTPTSPDEGVCLFFANNNPTNAHPLTVSVHQTGDTHTTFYTNNPARFVQDTLATAISSIPAASMVSTFVHTNAGARVVISFSGTTALGGSPDTMDAFLVETSHTACGPIGAYVGPVAGIDPSGVAHSILQDQTGHLWAMFPNPCTGGTLINDAFQAVPTSLTTVPNATANTCIYYVRMCNTTAGALTINLTDAQGTPVQILPATFSLPALNCWDWTPYGALATAGVKWAASGAGVTGTFVGVK